MVPSVHHNPLAVQPAERWILFGLRVVALCVPTYLLIEAARVCWDFPPAHDGSLFYALYYAWIITPLHEGGHLLFMFFDDTLHFLGGSFWQVMFPLLLAVVAWKKESFFASVYLILAGVHLVVLAPYIFDANFRVLQLLGPRHGHDWYNLLYVQRNWIDLAGTLSQIAYFSGVLGGVSGVFLGLTMALKRFLKGA